MNLKVKSLISLSFVGMISDACTKNYFVSTNCDPATFLDSYPAAMNCESADAVSYFHGYMTATNTSQLLPQSGATYDVAM
jgi:hypothetical protein